MSDIFTSIPSIEDKEFDYLKTVIYERTGISLAPHKKIMLQSRLNVRLRTNQISTFADYVTKLKTERNFYENEVLEIINRITTNKTDFFRENHHFEYLRDKEFHAIEARQKSNSKKTLRIWSSACSTGEEPYSIAMTVLEYFQLKPGWDIKIFASDIDTNVLKTAETGIYREDKLTTISPEYLRKYMTLIKTEKGEKDYQIKQFVKDLIIFKKINLLDSAYPLPDKMDIVFCRNVIIYFDKPTQKKIFENLEKVLVDDGLLVIGHSETLFGISDNFKFLGHTVYQKKTHSK